MKFFAFNDYLIISIIELLQNQEELPVSMATPNYLIEENTYYPIENRTGYRGLDNHATPYDVVVSYKPYEKKKFFLLCGAWDLEDGSLEEYLDQLTWMDV